MSCNEIDLRPILNNFIVDIVSSTLSIVEVTTDNISADFMVLGMQDFHHCVADSDARAQHNLVGGNLVLYGC
jgi:hypothetical protein